jgi:hypothetical protein
LKEKETGFGFVFEGFADLTACSIVAPAYTIVFGPESESIFVSLFFQIPLMHQSRGLKNLSLHHIKRCPDGIPLTTFKYLFWSLSGLHLKRTVFAFSAATGSN